MGLADYTSRKDVGHRLRWNLEQEEQVREAMLAVLRRSPREWGLDRTRWRLQDMLTALGATLPVTSVSGLWHLCQRLGIRYRQSWAFKTSPDPFVKEKLDWIHEVCQQAEAHPGKVVVLWMDELTVYLSPSVAPTWSDGRAKCGRKAQQVTTDETYRRIVATLDHVTGQVCYHFKLKVGKQALCEFYPYLRHQYPDAERIYVIQDCCPTHFLDEVCQVAEQVDITMVPLPTYSSWRNYIEQLWRWLKQEVIHMHPWSDNWEQLESEIRLFLDRFRDPNTSLLRYVGLSY